MGPPLGALLATMADLCSLAGRKRATVTRVTLWSEVRHASHGGNYRAAAIGKEESAARHRAIASARGQPSMNKQGQGRIGRNDTGQHATDNKGCGPFYAESGGMARGTSPA